MLAFTRLAGALGILTPIVMFGFILVAIGLSPWFSWQKNDLSDLGLNAMPNPFNATLAIGGAFYLVFVIGLLRWLGPSSFQSKLGGALMGLGAVALLLSGILTEYAGRIHHVMAVVYFVATPLAYLCIGAHLLRQGEVVAGVLSLAAGLAIFCMIFAVPHDGWAVPEILAALIIGAWTLSFGVKLLFAVTKDAVSA